MAIVSMILAGGHDLIRTKMIVGGASRTSKPVKRKKKSRKKSEQKK